MKNKIFATLKFVFCINNYFPRLLIIQATVHPAEKFSYAQDGEKLKREMKGFGTDEQAIIKILVSSSHSQRLLIVKYLLEENNRELLEELKEELGEKFDDLTYALLTPPAEYFAYELNSLLEAENVDERALIEIVCTRSSDEIKETISQYSKCESGPLFVVKFFFLIFRFHINQPLNNTFCEMIDFTSLNYSFEN